MAEPGEWLHSVEAIAGVWLGSIGLLAALAWKSLRGLRRGHWRRLVREERGAAYTLSYVMATPIFVLLMCLVVETSLVLVAKLGTMVAAYAAARSAAVWESAAPSGRAEEKARLAAVHALVPVSSGSDQHAALGGANSPRLAAYLAAYQKNTAARPIDSQYLGKKYRYALAATQVALSHPQNGVVEAEVRYAAALHIPGIARLFGKPAAGGRFYAYPIVSRARVASETPQSADGTLGIDYRSE